MFVPLHAGIHPLGRHPPSQTPPTPGQTPPTGQTPPFLGYYGIYSTSGRYASYWNAYLFFMHFVPLFVRNIQLISTIFNCFLLFQIHITKNIDVRNRLLVSKCDSSQVSHQVLRKVLRKYTQISCGRSGRRIQSGF